MDSTAPGWPRLTRLAAIVALLGSLIVGLRFTSAYQIVRHFIYYGDAESTAETIRQLTFKLESLDEASVRQLLESDEFRELKTREVTIALLPREVMWFKVNDMFTIGLRDDGGILWMIEGVRASDQ
jgi:hypothetical protein